MSFESGILLVNPAVCAVEDCYVIAVPVRKKVLMHIEIGGKKFFNHSNGARVTDTCVQMFRVPADLLNRHKEYKLVFKQVYLRLPYYVFSGKEQTATYKFKPVEKTENINICHISDCHGQRNAPAASGAYFGNDLDLLVLNGDISGSSNKTSQILLTYKIASDITKGEHPVIISRGNHDLRGKKAELLEKLLPTVNGKSYFTASLGNMWFLITDCGEDKRDDHPEYSGTAAFHCFREEETEFIRKVVNDGSYDDGGFKYRFVISHIPFPIRNTEPCKNEERPFDIENDIYNEWCGMINASLKPQLFLGGHFHEAEVIRKNSDRNARKICCDIILGGKPVHKTDFICANITVSSNGCTVRFADKNRNIVKEEICAFTD
ncbi:MAG: metallophosphoesterase family protein [Acutalibacteraceae bacterium]